MLDKESGSDVRRRRFRTVGVCFENMVTHDYVRRMADPERHLAMEGAVVSQSFSRFCKEHGLKFKPRRGDSTLGK